MTPLPAPERHVFIEDGSHPELANEYVLCLAVFPAEPNWYLTAIRIIGQPAVDDAHIAAAELHGWIVLRSEKIVFLYKRETPPTLREIYQFAIAQGCNVIMADCYNRQRVAIEEKFAASGSHISPQRLGDLEAQEILFKIELKTSPFSDD